MKTHILFPAVVVVIYILGVIGCSAPFSSRTTDGNGLQLEFQAPVLSTQLLGVQQDEGRYILPSAAEAEVLVRDVNSDFRHSVTAGIDIQDGTARGTVKIESLPPGTSYQIQITVLADGGSPLHLGETTLEVTSGQTTSDRLYLLPHPEQLPDSAYTLDGVRGGLPELALAAGEHRFYAVDMPGAGDDTDDTEYLLRIDGRNLPAELAAVIQDSDGSPLDPDGFSPSGERIYLGFYNEGNGSGAFSPALRKTEYTYTVSFKSDGVDILADPAQIILSSPQMTLSESSNAGMPADPLFIGSIFQGWNTKSDGSGAAFDADTPVLGDTELYAQFTPAPIIIPDTQGQQLIQIDGISGSGETILSGSDLGLPSFYPTDTEVDSKGRIYVAVSGTPSFPSSGAYSYSDSQVIRLDSINSTDYTVVYSDSGTVNIPALSMDYLTDTLYFLATDTSTLATILVRHSIPADTTESAAMGEFADINGLAYALIDSKEYIYYTRGKEMSRLVLSDFPTSVTEDLTPFSLSSAESNALDVVYHEPHIIVAAADYNPSVASKIMRLQPDGTEITTAHFGTHGDAASASGNLMYPQRFVAVNRRDKLYVTDGGGLDYYSTTHPGYLIAVKQEDADPYTITEWDTYAVGTAGSALLGYQFTSG